VTKRKRGQDRLTKKQTKYVRLLREVFELLGLDFENIRDYPSAEERSVHLKRVLVHLVRGEVITQFTLIDDLLTHQLAFKILANRVTNPWQSKRFRTVKAALAESRLPLSRKLDVFRSLAKVPDDVVTIISRLNKLRNHMAHQFFLDDLPKKLNYAGKNILSVEGLRLFKSDQERAFDYLISVPLP
jgi:hypothetical protein